MLKKNFIALSVMGILYTVGANGAFASDKPAATQPADNISTDASAACEGRNEGDDCMYIKDDTKFTGACQKHNDKLHCTSIKE